MFAFIRQFQAALCLHFRQLWNLSVGKVCPSLKSAVVQHLAPPQQEGSQDRLGCWTAYTGASDCEKQSFVAAGSWS